MKILVLAGGADQIALIEELKQRNHEVILLDYLPNPPAKKYVDKHIQESTLDVDKVREAAIVENADMVVTACTDQALLTVAKVSEDLHLPCYISYDKALAVTNKKYMKEKMTATGIPTSRYHILQSVEEVCKINDLTFPLVVKPVDCNSSKGVIKVENFSGLSEPLSKAIQLSRTSSAIVEEYKDGIEISSDFYVKNTVPVFLSATYSTKIKGTNGFTINGSVYPVITEEGKKEITEIAAKIISSFDLKDTPLLIQTVLSRGKFYVIEFSARMGGGSKYRLIEQISGVNIMSKFVDLILGESPEFNPIVNTNFIRMIYIYCFNGVVSAINGLDGLIDNGTVVDFFQYKPIGAHIEKAETSSDRVLGLLVEAPSEKAMVDKVSKINGELSILNEVGQDIMMHNLL